MSLTFFVFSDIISGKEDSDMTENNLKAIEEAYAQAEAYFFKPFSSERRKSAEPHLYFIFSSPGAGKSTNIKPLLKNELAADKPVVLEVDELKSFVPENADVVKTVDDWFLKLINKAMEEKRSLIIMRQRNMLVPKQTLNIYKTAKEKGFITHANIVALDKARSRLGMIHRYEYALDDKSTDEQHIRENYPRKPDFLRHKIFYKAVPLITAFCSCSKYVDIVEVYDRERNKLAWNNKITGDKSYISPIRALFKERKRAWEPWEKEKFNTQKQQAKEKMKEHNCSILDMIKFKFLTRTRRNKS